ncbi:hypothetical protein DYB30_006609 [Aphanomyces astaci]|uniref:Uncharacterized protein n=1 Tax=Aphanomyces astaci TaxID=112090 RepID=A0A397DMK0_APHAT|nr:hypothetical protein DYB34_001085 [Aphanomyces astaci]RHY65188.1 hypothetical protein DYB38_006169 [Aphanomyces astaci]RHY69355.1 hypothetical protein DYB30_006609 [Aphanomyces astaci]
MARGLRKVRPQLSSAYISKWLRVLSNMSAGLLIIGTGALVSLLLYQGMFYSQRISPMTQDRWSPLFQSCVLNSSGFVLGSCDPDEVASTGAIPWTSVGAQLARDLQRNDSSEAPVYVATCVIGGYNGTSWANLMFLVGEHGFPKCKPMGKQVVLGMASLETVGTDDFPLGAFLLSTFADARPVRPVQIATVNGVVTVIQSTVKTIIAPNGSTFAAPWEQRNYVTSVNSLNRLFLMRLWLVAHYLDISSLTDTLDGYSVGSHTGMAVAFGWDHSHTVDHYMLLLAFQVLICFVSLGLLSNDGVITLEGLSGLLKNKPVLTYDILASLERRKLLLVSLVCTFFFSPLYADAIRYTYAETGYHYWYLALLMVAVMMALSWMALLTSLQSVPVPKIWRNRPLCYSAPVFIYCTILFFVIYEGSFDSGKVESEAMWSHAKGTLGLVVHGQTRSSGAYTMTGMTPVIYLIMPDLVVCMLVAWGVSIAAHKWHVGYAILDTSWTSHNEFVNQLPKPQWVTSLNLDHKNTISIGSKLFCKPSLLVLLGYCIIRDKGVDATAATTNLYHPASSHHSSTHDKVETASYVVTTTKEGTTASRLGTTLYAAAQPPPHSSPNRLKTEFIVISIYDLVAALLPWIRRLVYSPHQFGTITTNKFLVTKSHTRLHQKANYTYSRGDCCG